MQNAGTDTDGARLLSLHVNLMLSDPAQWAALFVPDAVWELAFAPSLGHPARLDGVDAIVKHAQWFGKAVNEFRYSNVAIQPFADPTAAVVTMNGEGVIAANGRVYKQEYVVFLRSANGKITYLREYFDPVRAARSMDIPL